MLKGGEKMSSQEFGVSEGNERIELSDFMKSAGINLIYFGIGTLMASAGSKGYFSPLGIAFCSGAKKEYTLFSCFGAMLGYILTNEYIFAFRYVMALIMVYILKLYVHSFPKLRNKVLLPCVISLFSTLSTGIVATIVTPFELNDIFLRVAESATAFGGAYFFTVGFNSLNKIRAGEHLTNRELTTTIIAILILILSASPLSVFGVSLSGICCSFIIICAAYLFRESGGAIMGTGVSLGFLMMGNSDLSVFTYCISGLFSGLFSYSGRVLCAFSYIFAYGASFLLFESAMKDISSLVETAIASILFVVVPQKVFLQLKIQLSFSSLAGDGVAMQNMVILRLKMVKNAVGDMSGTVSKVSQILKEKAAPDTTGVYLRVRDNVCDDCASFDKCWKNGMPATIGEFDSIVEEIRKTGSVTPSFVPSSLQGRCIRIMSLCDSFNKNYSSYSARLGAEGRINEMRKITADQFDSVCEMLDDMLCDFNSDIRLFASKSNALKNALDDIGVPAFVNCYENEELNMIVNLTIDVNNKVPENEIKECIEKVTEKEFSAPAIIKNDVEKNLMYWEKPSYSAQCIFHQLSADGNDVCGDCIDSFYDGKGNFITVLSDGMGTGHRAAIDGAMVSSLFSRLIISGFSFPCALRLVNSAMLVKSREESLATLDILKTNLYTGQSIIYKAGATVSLLYRKGKVSEIKKSAMPIGILRQAEFATIRGGLKDGDVIIMMSDGAADSSLEEIKQYIKENGFSEDLPQKLCVLAKGRNVTRGDDITVAAVKISFNEE